MDTAELRRLIHAGLPQCEVAVCGEGCNVSVVVIGEIFAGMNPLKRQQRVLATVSAPLSSGGLHAISMKVYTPGEWRAEQARQAAEPEVRHEPAVEETRPASPLLT